MSPLVSRVSALAVLALAAAVRLSTPAAHFREGRFVPADGDAAYHVRRAASVFDGGLPLPSVFDPFLGFPEGATVPWAPGWDMALALFAWLCGGLSHETLGYQVGLALFPLWVGVATVAVTMELGRRLYNDWVGLWAGLGLALIPQHVAATQLGRPDHSGAEGLFMALFALEASRPRPRPLVVGGLVVGVVLTGVGGLAYAAMGLGALCLAGLFSESPFERAGVKGWALGVLILAPLATGFGLAGGRGFTAAYLSGFQPVALGAVAVGGLWLLGLRAWPHRRRALALGAGLSLIAVAVAVAVALAPSGLIDAGDGLLNADPWLATEMKAMVSSPVTAPASWEQAWRLGGWGFLAAPLLWIGLAWEARRPRDPARAAMLAIALGLLVGAHLQSRLGWAFAPFSAVMLAAALGRGPGGALLVVLSVARGFDEADAAWVKPKTANVRLAWVIDACAWLREETPPVSPDQPEWGVASSWPYGRFVSGVGERPEHFGPFGTTAGGLARFAETEAMFHAAEAELLTLMDRDRLRYLLVTSRDLTAVTGPLRALRHGGSAGADVPALTGLRAVYVSNRLDPSVSQRVPAAWVYERVAGAHIEGVTQPGVTVPLALDLLLSGTRGRYVAEAVADSEGRYQLTVPYWTGATGEVRTARAARLGLPEGPVTFEIPEEAVRDGLRLTAPSPPSLVPVEPTPPVDPVIPEPERP
ncbi:hypothetical protein L6R46_27850 [Myxococcota bacterium]|nr:hypothetical protein [Myxococcota bacterium]